MLDPFELVDAVLVETGGVQQRPDQDGLSLNGYIPMFIAGFAEVDVVGACERLPDQPQPKTTSLAEATQLSPQGLAGRPMAWSCPITWA